MPLKKSFVWYDMLRKVITRYKDGTQTTEILYTETSTNSYIPSDDVVSVASQMFKYEVEHPTMNPALFSINGKKYIIPQWIEVHPLTTIDDVDWVKPKPKVEKVTETFTSGSGMGNYKTTYNPATQKYSCNCMGYFRSKDKRCKHIKELEIKMGQ